MSMTSPSRKLVCPGSATVFDFLTELGFGVLYTSAFPPNHSFAVLAGSVIFVAVIADLYVLPALLLFSVWVGTGLFWIMASWIRDFEGEWNMECALAWEAYQAAGLKFSLTVCVTRSPVAK